MNLTDVQADARPPLEGNLIPAFELPRAGGGRVRVRGYRGRHSLALYFLHSAGCAPCRDLVAAIVPRYGDYALADAEPLLILPGPQSAAEGLRHELALPFPVLVDEHGAVVRRYRVTGDPGGEALVVGGAVVGIPGDPALQTGRDNTPNSHDGTPGAALLVADRFGAPVLWRRTGAGHDLPDQDDILRELEYLAHTCGAGCATPIWPKEGDGD